MDSLIKIQKYICTLVIRVNSKLSFKKVTDRWSNNLHQIH